MLVTEDVVLKIFSLNMRRLHQNVLVLILFKWSVEYLFFLPPLSLVYQKINETKILGSSHKALYALVCVHMQTYAKNVFKTVLNKT